MKKYPIDSCDDCPDCVFLTNAVECEQSREQLKKKEYDDIDELLVALFNQCPLEDY